MNDETCTKIGFHWLEGERSETFASRVIKIGRLASSHLRIEHDDVSRMHAVVEIDERGDAWIVDLGSAKGTFVDGKRVNKARLSSGDVLSLGSVQLRVEIAAPEAAALAPKAPAAPPRSAIRLPSPFAAPPALAAGHADGEDGAPAIRWGIATSGPALNPADVETTAPAAEVVLMWGDESVLHVAHMSPPRPFWVGERADGREVDYAIDAELLGVTRAPLVLESNGQVVVVVPEGASVELSQGDAAITGEALDGRLSPCSELAGARQLVVPPGALASVRWSGFHFQVRATSAGKTIGTELGAPSWRTHAWTAMSLGFHAALLVMFYFMPPGSSALSLDLVDERSRLVEYLDVAEVAPTEEVPEWLEDAVSESEGGTGEAHAGDAGEMGETTSERTTNRYGVEGPADNPDLHLARDSAREAARNAGAIGALAAITGSWMSPTSPFGADTASGADPMSALGALMGDNIGSSFGFGGLGPHGTGLGGGGTGIGTIGLGRLGTLGHGSGTGPGSGYGDGVDLRSHGPASHHPEIHTEPASVVGGLSREVIRRTVRRHINEVRFCYEQELSNRPDLAGRVAIAFMIGANGAVTQANVASSSLNNDRVESCIAGAVRRWTFPAPEGGMVGVTYPFVLESSE